MPETTPATIPATTRPEFSRRVTAEALREGAGAEIATEAAPAERDALRDRFGVPEVRAFAVTATVGAWGPGGWRVSGRVEARLVQTCVVTLEPVETALAEPFERFFAPPARLEEAAALLDEDARDELEPLGAAIDLGEIAAEAAALAIDPYPRAPGAVFDGAASAPPGAAPLTPEALRPFARLAALRNRGKD
jgi:uncharacterized metal-binding protein YceD (DUF177 family)